jgi:cytoskeletal protein RodZ
VAEGIGTMLREARLRRRIELAEVERTTRIRLRFLRAMEEERWELLPGAAYERSFLRTYASYLGLDAEALVERLRRAREPAAEAPVDEVPPPLQPGGGRGLRLPARWAVLAGVALAAGVGAVVATRLAGGGGHTQRAPIHAPPASTTSSSSTTTQIPEASVRLTATGTVWVCLVDDRGRALIDGLTLSPGEARGPFRGSGFDLNLGNGYVRMQADGKTVAVPPVAAPLGYRISTRGVRELPPAARPTCL